MSTCIHYVVSLDKKPYVAIKYADKIVNKHDREEQVNTLGFLLYTYIHIPQVRTTNHIIIASQHAVTTLILILLEEAN